MGSLQLHNPWLTASLTLTLRLSSLVSPTALSPDDVSRFCPVPLLPSPPTAPQWPCLLRTSPAWGTTRCSVHCEICDGTAALMCPPALSLSSPYQETRIKRADDKAQGAAKPPSGWRAKEMQRRQESGGLTTWHQMLQGVLQGASRGWMPASLGVAQNRV